MKKQISLLLVLIAAIAFPQMASAHSHYESSTPGDGEEVNEQVSEIIVSFDGGIATGTITVTNEETDEEVGVASVESKDSSMVATLENPLENGTYYVEWENIGDDTHAIDGTFTFTVNAPEDATSEDERTAEEDAAINAEDEESNEAPEEREVASETDEDASGSAIMWISIILGALFIIGLIAFVFSRRKK